MGKQLDKKSLLAKQDFLKMKVEFENGDFVWVREMSGHERDVFEQSLVRKLRDKKGAIVGYEQATEDFRAKLAVCTICDEEGNLILEPKDYPTLSYNMGAKRLETIINEAQKLNKISEEDKEGLIKNLDAVPDGSSSSASAES